MEQYTRFELVLYPWQGHVLPLHQYCIWLSGRELNPRPHDYQSCALTNWATKQYKTRHYWFTAFYHWTNPLYQGAKAPLNSSPIATLPGELWQGMKGIEPTLPAWQAIKIAVNVFNLCKYYNIFFFKCQIIFWLRIRGSWSPDFPESFNPLASPERFELPILRFVAARFLQLS